MPRTTGRKHVTFDDMRFHHTGRVKIVLLTVVIAMAVSVCVVIYESIITKDRAESIALLCVAGLFLSYIVIGLLVFPFSATVKGDKLIIKKVMRPETIRLADVIRYSPIEKQDLENSAQKVGYGGVIGYWGRYENPSWGDYTLYTFDLRNLHLMEMRNGKRYIISLVPRTEEEKLFMKKLEQSNNEME